MTIAEIHGKLTPYEALEDLLTSDVFGTFKYLLPEEGLIPFLEKAVPFCDQKAKPHVFENVTSAKYYFWPSSLDLREPDLIIILTREDGTMLGINIECKYHGGKHSIETEGDLQPSESPIFVGDQLADQYLQLRQSRYAGELGESLRNCSEKYLLYVTTHYALPAEEIEETLRKLTGDLDSQKNFYWVSWREIQKINPGKILDGLRQHLLNDLQALLACKGLIPLNIFREEIHIVPRSKYFWRPSQRFWSFEIEDIRAIVLCNKFFWMGG